MNVSNVAYRGTTNGQGSVTGTLPTNYMAGQPGVIIRGFQLRVQDSVAAATIRIAEARGTYALKSPTAATTFTLTFPTTGTALMAPKWIPFGPNGIWFPFWHFFLTSGTAVWAPAARTITEVGAFASYTWAAGDKFRVLSGTGVAPGDYTIASKDSNDQITLVELISDQASTNVTGWIGYPGGFTALTTNASTTGVIYFNHVAGDLDAMQASRFMFINTTTAAHPTDGIGGNTTSLPPANGYGAGRTGARIRGITVTAAAAGASTISLGQANGSATQTWNIAAGAACPINIEFPEDGMDYYSSSDGLFTCWSSDAGTTGVIYYDAIR